MRTRTAVGVNCGLARDSWLCNLITARRSRRVESRDRHRYIPAGLSRPSDWLSQPFYPSILN
ncbi:hypothetical protein OUZ56_021672 [Daphnia magna]|uniref:Uncharacterized protein n=1 Tax=Daphnia magna TaxID=35525 RepID=A0ABR0AU74_9CRUS|nr:hypothetical protein OUZ56_021672 [Daphnia magna]